MKIARILRIKQNLTTKPAPRDRGQILILVAVAMVAILALMALAVDGGSVYFERRHAQNAADAAAMAGAVEIAKGNSNGAASNAAFNIAAANNYDASMTSVAVTSGTDTGGEYVDVKVDIDSVVKTSVAHMFGFSSVKNTSSATARVRIAGPVMPGNAIIAMGNCLTGDPSGLLISNGGGGSNKPGGIWTRNGGMFINTPEKYSNRCALQPPSSPGSIGIYAFDGEITSVGSYSYSSGGKIFPKPIKTKANGGTPITDPLAFLSEPQCDHDGSYSGGVYSPGNYPTSDGTMIGDGVLDPGLYCINTSFSLSGQESLTGSGVVLYFKQGGLSGLTGKAELSISAPNATDCPEISTDPKNVCTYRGMAIFAARNNANSIDLGGNGDAKVTGMVYTLSGELRANGGGTTSDEWIIRGQVIAKSVRCNGGGTFGVTYDENNTVWGLPDLSLYH